MKKHKILCLLLSAVMLTGILTGCGAKTASASTSNQSTSSTGTLEKVLKSKKLIVGSLLDNAPFGSKDKQGNPIGYDVDVIKMLAKSLGVNYQIVGLTVPERITALETGKVDVVVGNFTATLERAQKVDFTNPYDAGSPGILILKDSTIAHAKDLAGKKVGTTKGSTDQISCNNLIKAGVKMNLTLFDTESDMETALENKQVDAIVMDGPYCDYYARMNPSKFKTAGQPSEMEMPAWYNSLGVRKGDQEWLNYLNQFVFKINTDGENKASHKKWFGKDLGIPLNPKF